MDTINENTQCLYDPTNHTVFDIVKDGKTEISGHDAAEYAEKNNLEFWTLDDAVEHKQNSCLKDVQEITADEYQEALEILPPIHWQQDTFKCSEMYSGIITSIYCLIRKPGTDNYRDDGHRYFVLRDKVTMKPREIRNRCLEFMAEKDTPPIYYHCSSCGAKHSLITGDHLETRTGIICPDCE